MLISALIKGFNIRAAAFQNFVTDSIVENAAFVETSLDLRIWSADQTRIEIMKNISIEHNLLRESQSKLKIKIQRQLSWCRKVFPEMLLVSIYCRRNFLLLVEENENKTAGNHPYFFHLPILVKMPFKRMKVFFFKTLFRFSNFSKFKEFLIFCERKFHN